MVLIASASHRHHRHRAAKSHPPANAASPPPSKVPAEKSSARAGLLGFSFSWGAHRRLRCSKDGAPVYDSFASPPPPPPKNPNTPSPENSKPPPQDTPVAGCSAFPQRPRSLRSRHAASRPDGAGKAALLATLLQSPTPAAKAKPRRKRGFAVALTREEIARDFAAIRGCTTRPVPAARRAKKRVQKVQKKIDMMCPGSSLWQVDLDNYKIEERGL